MQTIFKKSALFFLILTVSLLTFVGMAFAEENVEMSLDEIIASYAGKKVSVIGDSISTYSGISNDTETNTTIGNNPHHYSTSFGVNNTWWQQVINTLGMERLVINAWSGSTVLKDNKGTDSAMYKTRCVNLHNDITGEMPDVILVFGGTNDFTHHKSTLGTAAAINYDTLIVSNGDGTFTYAVPATTLEAYAIMLHKIQIAYPDAEVFCANLLLRRDPVLPGKTNAGQPTEFNKELEAVIEKMGVRLVDFENCGLESTPEIYDNYVTDQNVHPGAKGMDLMSAAVLSEMLGVDCHPIIFNSVGTQRSNTAFYAINGNAFETDITLKKSYTDLAVSVTMDGEDITSSVYANGKLSIPSVTGHVVINATANAEYLNHLMQFETDVCCESNIWSVLKKEKYYFDGSAWNTKYYSVTFPVNPGERISATSFGAKGSNGNDSTNGIRITYFYSDGTFKSISPADVYNDYKADGYVIVPANAVAVNIPMWTSSSSYEIKLLDREHIYEIGTATGGYAAYICSVCGAEGEKIDTVKFDGAVTLEGFSIKLESTETAVNGLRSISNFDWEKNATYEENGYELLQFGAIAISKPQYDAANGSFTIDAETSTLSGAKGIVAPVWKDGKYVGNTLVRDVDKTQFALTIVNYEDNFTTDVYFAAYSIYSKDGVDEPIVTISSYPDEEYQFMNIYQLTLDMYVNGAINASNTDDSAVWNTLQSGVVTLTSSQYGTGATDMNGNAFGDSFTFKDVSSMGNGNVTNEKIKITLFHDYKTGEYVAIWRGTGRIANCNSGYSQFYSGTERTKMSHPILTSATSKKITTMVFDDGITGINAYYVMRGTYAKTFVYPSTFTYMGASVFHTAYNTTTMYQAKATGHMQENEVGLIDLSGVTSLTTTNLFYKGSPAFTKLKLPSTVTALGDAFISHGGGTTTKYKAEKIWVDGTDEPEAGVIDLSGAKSLTKITGSTFSSMSGNCSSYVIILPDSLTSISNNAIGNTPVTEIRQAKKSENLVAGIAANTYIAGKIKYADLSGNEWVTQNENNTLRVLAIGNSFSVDAMEYLWDITNEAIENGETDYEFVSLGNLYIGSCSLDTHWSNIQNDSASYIYYTNSNGKWTSESNYKLSEALISQDWDIITVQQVSGSSGKSETFDNLQNIIDYVNANKTNENAKIFWHMTWAYQQDSTKKEFANYNKDQMTMYNAIIDATESTILTNSSIAGVIPGGTAVQNARTSYVGDTLTRDGYHMSYDLGRYITALTWFAYITGESVDNVQWTPSSYSSVALHLDVAKEAVKNAIASPYAVTQSLLTEAPGYTDEELFALNNLDIANYTALDLTPYTNFQKYYQSETALPSAMTSGTSTAKKYIGIGLFTKESLPVGSVIVLDDGYQYRPEGWVDENTKNSTRPGNVTKQFVVTDDAWWGNFTIRGFNLAYEGAGSNVTTGVSEKMRIYVPVKKVLFIGNSFTYYNDMSTAIFPALAETMGYGVDVTSITNGGHTLAEFASSTDTYGKKVAAAFAENKFDVVILQEQSHRPISNPTSFYDAVRALVQMANANGAKTYLYATWGYDADHSSLSTYGKDTADMEMKLRASYEYIADELNIPLCHVGAAMTYAFTNSSVSLYKSDNYHPVTNASTLAAMTILSEIYNVDPANFAFTYEGVSEATMTALKQAASYVHNNDMSVPEEYKIK